MCVGGGEGRGGEERGGERGDSRQGEVPVSLALPILFRPRSHSFSSSSVAN